MTSAVVIVPGSIGTRTGGYGYDRRMVDGLRSRGWTIDVRELDATFPHPTAAALTHAAAVLASIPDGTTVVVDGLAFGAMPDEVEYAATRLRLVALVHMPLAADVSLDRETAARLRANERRALEAAARVVVTGTTTRAALIRDGVPEARIVLVEPGTAAAPVARGSGDSASLHLVCVATINSGKGHEILVRALAGTAVDRWRLTCAGSLDRDPTTVARVRGCVASLALDDRVVLAGELADADLEALYHSADLFVLATLHESYGMAVAEALAHGLPVVSTATGAIPDLVGPDAGLIVPPGDIEALTGALSRAIGDARLRSRLREGARRVRSRLPSWEDAAEKMAAVLDE